METLSGLGDSGHFFSDETEWDVPADFDLNVENPDDDQNMELKNR
jgi:hypothetical protein